MKRWAEEQALFVVDDLVIQFLERVPKNLASRGFGAVSEIPLPQPLQGAVNEAFAAAAGIDRGESEREPHEYRTLNDFFTRRLRSDAREIEAERQTTAVSPVDGTFSAHGRIEDGTLIQAKGREYSVLELLDSGAHAEHFQSGVYATLYLSPRDYHRIHSPVSAAITEVSYVPGELFPVFPMAVENVDRLFAINERLISMLDVGEHGHLAVVKVGATCVGRISLTFHDWQTNMSYRRRRVEQLEEPVEVSAGDEIGVFNLGSTVVLLFSEPGFSLDGGLGEGEPVRMGQRLGSYD